MARKLIWKVDQYYQVELRYSFPAKTRILVNGKEVEHQKTGKRNYSFSLEDGRPAEISIAPYGIFAPDRELRVQGQVVLSEKQLKKIACPKCGQKFGSGDKFCQKCGAELPNVENQLKLVRLGEARTTIGYLSLMFLVFGAIFYFVTAASNQKALDNLATFQDNQVYPKEINGKQYTVGELKNEIRWESNGILVTNGILAAIMLGLYFYATKSPLTATILAAAIYGSVIVLNAIVDPKSIAQGLLVKIIVIVMFVRAIRSALELRKVEI